MWLGRPASPRAHQPVRHDACGRLGTSRQAFRRRRAATGRRRSSRMSRREACPSTGTGRRRFRCPGSTRSSPPRSSPGAPSRGIRSRGPAWWSRCCPVRAAVALSPRRVGVRGAGADRDGTGGECGDRRTTGYVAQLQGRILPVEAAHFGQPRRNPPTGLITHQRKRTLRSRSRLRTQVSGESHRRSGPWRSPLVCVPHVRPPRCPRARSPVAMRSTAVPRTGRLLTGLGRPIGSAKPSRRSPDRHELRVRWLHRPVRGPGQRSGGQKGRPGLGDTHLGRLVGAGALHAAHRMPGPPRRRRPRRLPCWPTARRRPLSPRHY